VAEAAELGAGQLVLARLGHLEPLADLPPRHRVLLHPELGYEEAVDDVLRLEDDVDHLVHRHVDLVEELLVVLGAELAVRARVRDLPVELLGRDLDDEIARRQGHLDARPGRHRQHGQDHEDDRGHDGPDDLERGGAVRVARAPPGPVTVRDQERDHRDRDQDEGHAGDPVDDVEQPVDIPPVRRDVFRQPPVEHAICPSSRR
jgi:hypothetical protein